MWVAVLVPVSSIAWCAPLGIAAQDYRDIAAEAGLVVVTGTGGPEKNHIAESTGTGVAVLDYDQDGLPDLYFPNAPTWEDPNGAWRSRSGALYRNGGDGRFTDVTEAAGVATGIYGQGAVSADIDADGLPDLYVTALGPNLLFRNNGDGTFSEIAQSAGVADPGWGIGAVFLDGDGDRTVDLFVTNYIETSEPDIRAGLRTRRWRGRVPVLDGPRGLVPETNRYFRGRGDGTFEDATSTSGVGDVPARYSMGVVALDFDKDGDQDIFVANDSGPNAMLENRGGIFRDAGLLTGVALSADGATQGSMGVAAADADEDGFPDLVVTNFAHDHYAFYVGVAPSLFLEDAVGTGIATATFRPLGWGALFFDAENDGDLDVAFANGHLYPQVVDDPALGETYGQPDQLFRREGQHEFRFGVQIAEGVAVTGVAAGPNSAYQYQAGGVIYQVIQEPYRYGGISRDNGFFVDDTITVNDRLTLNLGLRLDINRGEIPAYELLASVEGGAESEFTAINAVAVEGTAPGDPDIVAWNLVSPRIGFTSGRTTRDVPRSRVSSESTTTRT